MTAVVAVTRDENDDDDDVGEREELLDCTDEESCRDGDAHWHAVEDFREVMLVPLSEIVLCQLPWCASSWVRAQRVE